jgi:hypothetical protein
MATSGLSLAWLWTAPIGKGWDADIHLGLMRALNTLMTGSLNLWEGDFAGSDRWDKQLRRAGGELGSHVCEAELSDDRRGRYIG